MLSNNFEENHVLLLKCDEFMDVNLTLDSVSRKGGHQHRARSRLWPITESAQNMFSRTEHYFRQSTLKGAHSLQQVDIAGIAQKSASDSDVVLNYQTMVSDAELVPTKNASKDVLHSIVNLYIRVRSFSLAKDIIQDFKIKAKQSKDKALHKEIQRSCDKQTQENHN